MLREDGKADVARRVVWRVSKGAAERKAGEGAGRVFMVGM